MVKVIKFPLLLAVYLLPFTGIEGISSLGELRGVASVYVLLLFSPFAIAQMTSNARSALISRESLILFVLLTASILASALSNFGEISSYSLKERSGVSKLLGSTSVLVFGIFTSCWFYSAIRTVDDLILIFFRPLVWSVWTTAIFSIPEIFTWFFPSAWSFYDRSTGLTQSATTLGDFWREPGRLASVAFEAPDLAYYSAICVPWLLCCKRLSSLRGGQSENYLIVTILLCCTMCILAGSRTGYIMLSACFLSEIVFLIKTKYYSSRSKKLYFISSFVYVLFGVSILLEFFDIGSRLESSGVAAAMAGDTSGVSRAATLYAQICLFKQGPFFGKGLGQYAFAAYSCMPEWGLRSFEIQNWFFSLDYGMPPTFNFWGRLGSELGLFGLGLWFAWFSFYLGAVKTKASGAVDPADRIFLIACFSEGVTILAGGASVDAFRRIDTWIFFGLVGLFHKVNLDRHS